MTGSNVISLRGVNPRKIEVRPDGSVRLELEVPAYKENSVGLQTLKNLREHALSSPVRLELAVPDVGFGLNEAL